MASGERQCSSRLAALGLVWLSQPPPLRVLRSDYNASCQGTGGDGDGEGEMPLRLARAEEMVAEVGSGE